MDEGERRRGINYRAMSDRYSQTPFFSLQSPFPFLRPSEFAFSFPTLFVRGRILQRTAYAMIYLVAYYLLFVKKVCLRESETTGVLSLSLNFNAQGFECSRVLDLSSVILMSFKLSKIFEFVWNAE